MLRLCTEFKRLQQEHRGLRVRRKVLARLNICRKKGSGRHEGMIVLPLIGDRELPRSKSELPIMQRQEIC